MANYNLVVNSKFQPFSFERYIQPYQMYEEAYKNVENALGELSANASVWEKLANEQTDKEVYDMYKAYADDLNRSVEDLTKYGLNASSRRDLLNLRSRYRKEITPIEQAFNLRRQHIDEQRKMRQADNTVEFDMDASTARLIDYINNPSMTYTPVSKGLVTKRVADAVKNYSNTMLRNPSAWRNTASGQLLERIQQYGLTNADVQEIINNPNAFPEIQKLISDVVESTGVESWNKPKVLEAVKAAAREGLFAGLGKTIVDVQKNSNYLNDYEQKTPPPIPQYNKVIPKGNPYNLDVRNEIYGDKLMHDSYSKYFDKDGHLTEEGMKQYNSKGNITWHPSSFGSTEMPSYTQFRNFITNLTGKENATKEEIEKAYKMNAARFKGDMNGDIFRNTAFDVQFDDVTASNIITALTSGKNTGKHTVYAYSKEGYKDKGTINLMDDKFKDATVAGEYGLQGNYIVITDKDSEQYRIPLKAVNEAFDNAIKDIVNAANKLYYYRNNNPYTDEELDRVIQQGNMITTRRDEIYNLLNLAHDNFAAAQAVIKTEPIKVEGGLHQ